MRSYGITNAAPYATAPPVGSAGDTYFNTTSKTMFLSDGTQWIQVQGGSSTANYWASRLVANTVIGNNVWTNLPIDVASMRSGFTLVSGAVRCDVAGKYSALAIVGTGTNTATANPFWVSIAQMRGAATIVAWDHIGLAAASGFPYNQADAAGQFDMQVGDTLVVNSLIAGAGFSVLTQSSFFIWPMGGPKGDKGDTGPDFTASQSSYAYLGLVAGAVTANTWAAVSFIAATPPTTFINGFTASGINLVAQNAGRYRVQLEVSLTGPTSPWAWAQLRLTQFNSGGTQIASHDMVSTGISGNAFFAGPVHEVMFNMAVGDYIQGYVMTPLAGNVDARSSILVMPVGGTKGDKGDPGIAGNLASANYWWGSFTGPATINPSTKVQLLPAAPALVQGFHLHANGTVAVCDVAGLYRIGIHLSQSWAARTQYTDTYIQVHDPTTMNILASSNPVGSNNMGSSNDYNPSDGELIASLRVGDYVAVWMAVDAIHSFQASRSYLSIIPIGGAKGDPGTPGTSVGTTAWAALPFASGWSNAGGYAPCQYRLEGDRVFLRGGCTRNPNAISAGGSQIATMPVGFRTPVAAISYIVQVFGGGIRLDIGLDGSVVLQQDYKIGTPSGLQYLNLDGISWSITA
jgi:hypothetical protein